MSAAVRALFPSRFKRYLKNPYNRRVVEGLPEAYKKFYVEWQENEDLSTPVHWIPRTEKWERNPETGEVKVVQNCPIPALYPAQMDRGLWGGEGVVEGVVKKAKYRMPVPKFWVPSLQTSVVYSEILDKYFSVIVTERALRLIDEKFGLDFYILQTPAYDLKSLLALKLKRNLLMALNDKDFYHDDSNKREELYNKYKECLIPKEEIDWYGLTVPEAKAKYDAIQKSLIKKYPLKESLRKSLIESLERKNTEANEGESQSLSGPASWVKKINPFAAKTE